MRIARQSNHAKPRSPSFVATLAAVNDVWSTWKDIADRASGASTVTVKNNLAVLREELAIEARYGAGGRVEYRLPEVARG